MTKRTRVHMTTFIRNRTGKLIQMSSKTMLHSFTRVYSAVHECSLFLLLIRILFVLCTYNPATKKMELMSVVHKHTGVKFN
jgi:hypothetical protein